MQQSAGFVDLTGLDSGCASPPHAAQQNGAALQDTAAKPDSRQAANGTGTIDMQHEPPSVSPADRRSSSGALMPSSYLITRQQHCRPLTVETVQHAALDVNVVVIQVRMASGRHFQSRVLSS